MLNTYCLSHIFCARIIIVKRYHISILLPPRKSVFFSYYEYEIRNVAKKSLHVERVRYEVHRERGEEEGLRAPHRHVRDGGKREVPPEPLFTNKAWGNQRHARRNSTMDEKSRFGEVGSDACPVSLAFVTRLISSSRMPRWTASIICSSGNHRT